MDMQTVMNASMPRVVDIVVSTASGTQTSVSPSEPPAAEAEADDAAGFYASLFAPSELPHPASPEEPAGTLCAECGARYTCSAAEHQASIAHAAVAGSGATRHFAVPPTNLGYRMLERLGWDEESGLGKYEDGIIEPVTAVLRVDRAYRSPFLWSCSSVLLHLKARYFV